MFCPQCKNPVNEKDVNCEWCGYQIHPTQEPSVFERNKQIFVNIFKKTFVNFFKKIFLNRRHILAFLLILLLFSKLIYNSINSSEQESKIVTPKNWQEKRAFDYLTMVRYKIVNKSDSFENLALKYSQDTLSISHKGMEVNNGQLGAEFDEMVSKLGVNQLSKIFEIKYGNGDIKQYAIVKLLSKGNGFYKLQYITRNINLEVGQYYQGGIIAQLDDDFMHGLITSEKELQYDCSWWEAMEKCRDLELKGYNNWRLPSANELNSLYENKNLIGGFRNDYYWSYEGRGRGYIYILDFQYGQSGSYDRFYDFSARPVRSF